MDGGRDGEDINGNGRVDAGEWDPSDGSDAARDSDGDGLSDRDELRVHGTNPFSTDSDLGGIDDGAEIAHGTDPLARGDDILREVPEGDGGCSSAGGLTVMGLLAVLVLALVRRRCPRNGGVTVADISQSVELSPPTVSSSLCMDTHELRPAPLGITERNGIVVVATILVVAGRVGGRAKPD